MVVGAVGADGMPYRASPEGGDLVFQTDPRQADAINLIGLNRWWLDCVPVTLGQEVLTLALALGPCGNIRNCNYVNQ